jgi:methylenetetrahydrofolate reductase (NADPH)
MKPFTDLMKELQSKRFTFTGELEPEKITDLSEVVEEANALKGYVTACNVTDNPQSFAYMNSLVCSHVVQEKAGMEAVYQLTCRDRNRMALFSDLLGAAALEVRNVLALTGDYTSLGDMPESKPVFDLDSSQLVYMMKKMMDEGVDLNGKKITPPPKYYIGVAANPNSDPLEPEILKLEKKEKVGADFVQTQVVFDIETVEKFLDAAGNVNIPILIGVFPLKSYGVADFFDKYVPGVSVPKDLLGEFRKVKTEVEDKGEQRRRYDEINEEYFTEFIKEIKKTSAAGCHIMAVNYADMIKKLIENVR